MALALRIDENPHRGATTAVSKRRGGLRSDDHRKKPEDGERRQRQHQKAPNQGNDPRCSSVAVSRRPQRFSGSADGGYGCDRPVGSVKGHGLLLCLFGILGSGAAKTTSGEAPATAELHSTIAGC